MKPISLLPDIDAIGLGLFLHKTRTLVLADFHLGVEESLNRQGVLVPRFQFNDIKNNLEKLFAATRPTTIVLTGDLKHDFGRISELEWRTVVRLLDLCLKNVEKVVVIKGNHDPVLKYITERRNLDVVSHYETDGVAGMILVMHGDVLPPRELLKNTKTIIIGHEHPAITLQRGVRVEKYKCFLLGSYKRKHLIVLPAFNPLTTGTDILREARLSPFLKQPQPLDRFEVFVADEKSGDVLGFGKVKGMRKV